MLCLEDVFVLGGTLYLWIGTSWECCFVGVTSFLTRMHRRYLPSEDKLEAERFSEESLLIPDVVQRKCFGGDKVRCVRCVSIANRAVLMPFLLKNGIFSTIGHFPLSIKCNKT